MVKIDERLQRDGDMGEAAERLWQEAALEIGVQLIHRNARLQGDTPGVMRVRKFLEEEPKQCLVLSGNVGVGKTYAAAAALRERFYSRLKIEHRYVDQWTDHARYVDVIAGGTTTDRFWYVPQLFTAMLDPSRRPEAMESATEVPFLVLDDLGTEYSKDGGLPEALLDEIFYEREGNRLTTIVTTNMNPQQLADRYSPRIVDRLRGTWGRMFVLDGPSLRLLPQEIHAESRVEVA